MDQEGEALGVGGDWSSLPAERDSPKPIRNHAGVVHRGKALLCTLVPVVDISVFGFWCGGLLGWPGYSKALCLLIPEGKGLRWAFFSPWAR